MMSLIVYENGIPLDYYAIDGVIVIDKYEILTSKNDPDEEPYAQVQGRFDFSAKEEHSSEVVKCVGRFDDYPFQSLNDR